MDIKKTITNKAASELIESVVKSCIVRDEENGGFQYIPHLKDYAKRVYMMQYFGNIVFDDEQESLDAAYGDTYEEVYDTCHEQWDAINETIDDRINSIIKNAENNILERIALGIEALVAKDSPLDKFITDLSSLINSVEDNFEGVNMKQFASDIAKISETPAAENLVDALIRAKVIDGEKYNA